jgi:peptidyl-prolyl cis-trans isomerase-like 3
MSATLHTSLGDLKVEIACDVVRLNLYYTLLTEFVLEFYPIAQVPRASFNFLALAASGAYNNTVFHRNMKGFMIQGGDPTGTGKGGDSIWGGTFDDEFSGDLRHDRRGILSMANKEPNTNRAQFFITYAKQPHLNNKYTIIGKVIDGFEVLDAMERVPSGQKDRPLTELKLMSMTIHANPLAESEIVYTSPTGPPTRG